MIGHLSESELQRWLDGSLGPAGTKRVREHLNACTSCRERRDELAWLYQELKDVDAMALEVELPADLTDQVMTKLAAEPLPRRRDFPIVALCVAVATVALAIGLYVGVGGGLEAWRTWSIELAGRLGELSRTASGLWVGVRAAFGVVAPAVVALAVACAAGLAVVTRLAMMINRRRVADARAVEQERVK